MTFAEELYKIRIESGLTQKKAAELLGVPLRTYESWERELRVPASYVQSSVIERLRHETARNAHVATRD